MSGLQELLTAEQIDERYGPGDVQYYPATNEDGWKVADDPRGYRPDFDYHLIATKVMGIQLDLHEHGFIYVSNGTDGMDLAEAVAARCRQEQRFDQYSIIRFLLEHPYLKRHEGYWAERMAESGVLPKPTAADEMQAALERGETARLV